MYSVSVKLRQSNTVILPEVGIFLEWIEAQRNKAQKFCKVMKRNATSATLFLYSVKCNATFAIRFIQ